jgi:hypothetical protein
VTTLLVPGPEVELVELEVPEPELPEVVVVADPEAGAVVVPVVPVLVEPVPLPEVAGVAELVVVPAAALAEVEPREASAGSCPETSTSVIISHVATNRASATEMARRRSVRARISRASRIALPRARAASSGGGAEAT